MRHVPYFLGLSLGFSVLGNLGCSGSSTATTTIARPELVAVTPEDFLGTLGCGTEPGQVQSYVATLFDVTPTADGGLPDSPFQLPSSPPTSCLSPVTFSFVVTAHRYIAQIDAYDHPAPSDAPDSGATAITPTAPGSRLMQDAQNVRVTPKWGFTCGGYAPARVDGGANTYGGASSVSEGNGEAGEARSGNPLVGVLTYDGVTQNVHDCRAGLQMITQ